MKFRSDRRNAKGLQTIACVEALFVKRNQGLSAVSELVTSGIRSVKKSSPREP